MASDDNIYHRTVRQVTVQVRDSPITDGAAATIFDHQDNAYLTIYP